MSPVHPPHSRTIDSLRGVAALGVVVFHVALRTPKIGWSFDWTDLGAIGVQLFFVLSGFLIGKSVLSSRFNRRDYCLNRVFRIVPNYYFSILLMVTVVVPPLLAETGGVGNLLSHLAFVHAWFPDYFLSILGVYWTLSNEWLFYVLMLVVAPVFRHRIGGWWLTFLLIGGSVAYKWVIFHYFWRDASKNNFFSLQLPGVLDLFGCGMVMALVGRLPRFREGISRLSVKLPGLLVSLAALAWLLWTYSSTPHVQTFHWGSRPMLVFWPVGFAAACAAFACFLQAFEQEWGGWLKWTGLPYFGMISYSLYLYHLMVLRAFAPVINKNLDISPGVLVAWIVASMLIVASVMYFLVEKPFMDLRERWTKPDNGKL